MATEVKIADALNEQQLMMLRLFRKPLPEKDFQQLRRLAVKLLAGKLDQVTEKWEVENDIVASDYEKLSKAHFRTKSK